MSETPRPTFSYDELVQYLETEQGWATPPSGFFSVAQWAEILGVHERTARALLRKLYLRGELSRGFVLGEGMDGRHYRAPAYAIHLKGPSGTD